MNSNCKTCGRPYQQSDYVFGSFALCHYCDKEDDSGKESWPPTPSWERDYHQITWVPVSPDKGSNIVPGPLLQSLQGPQKPKETRPWPPPPPSKDRQYRHISVVDPEYVGTITCFGQDGWFIAFDGVVRTLSNYPSESELLWSLPRFSHEVVALKLLDAIYALPN